MSNATPVTENPTPLVMVTKGLMPGVPPLVVLNKATLSVVFISVKATATGVAPFNTTVPSFICPLEYVTCAVHPEKSLCSPRLIVPPFTYKPIPPPVRTVNATLTILYYES